MNIAIIGLPLSGKTTIFNAVTRGSAETTSYTNKANLGVAKVPDDRLISMSKIFNPKRITYAEVNYIDLPSMPEGLGETKGISGEYLNQLQKSDALLLVIRTFEDLSVPHVFNNIDSKHDLETMLYEISFVDIEILNRRFEKINEKLKSAKAQEFLD